MTDLTINKRPCRFIANPTEIAGFEMFWIENADAPHIIYGVVNRFKFGDRSLSIMPEAGAVDSKTRRYIWRQFDKWQGETRKDWVERKRGENVELQKWLRENPES